jgi:hypothetical protein
MSLRAEHHRALTFLKTAAAKGATQSLLAARGFSGAMISGMVNHGLVTVSLESFRAGGKMIKARMVRIGLLLRRLVFSDLKGHRERAPDVVVSLRASGIGEHCAATA